MTCASTVSHQVVACITTVDSCLSKRCSSSVTNLAISWVSQSTTVHNYVKSWNTSCTWYVTRYFTVIYTLFHIKISQEPTIPLELWHDYYSALGERKVGVHRRGAVHPRPPSLRQQSSYIVTLPLSYFLCVSINIQYNPLCKMHLVSCKELNSVQRKSSICICCAHSCLNNQRTTSPLKIGLDVMQSHPLSRMQHTLTGRCTPRPHSCS